MSKPYSEIDLSNQLTEDRTWRIREISDLKSLVERADAIQQRVLLRALVTICYAHWEGYVKAAAKKYLEHVAIRKIKFSELNRQYRRNYFLPRLAALSSNKGTLAERCALVDQILDSSDGVFSRVNQDLINTQSNLSYQIFRDICVVCGVTDNQYEGMQSFIDVFLLKRRNAIAHGEDTFVGTEDLVVLVEKTIELMRTFGDALDNQAVLQNYRNKLGAA